MGLCGSSPRPECLNDLDGLVFNAFDQRQIPVCPATTDQCHCCYYEQKIDDFKQNPEQVIGADPTSTSSSRQTWDYIVFYKMEGQDPAKVWYIRFFNTGCKQSSEETCKSKKVGHTSMSHDLVTTSKRASQVKYGGEIKALRGVFKEVNNRSGHFTPNGDFLDIIRTAMGMDQRQDVRFRVAFARFNDYGDFIGFGYREVTGSDRANSQSFTSGSNMNVEADYGGYDRGFAAGMEQEHRRQREEEHYMHQQQQSGPAFVLPPNYGMSSVLPYTGGHGAGGIQQQPLANNNNNGIGTDPTAVMVVLAVTMLSFMMCLLCTGAIAAAG